MPDFPPLLGRLGFLGAAVALAAATACSGGSSRTDPGVNPTPRTTSRLTSAPTRPAEQPEASESASAPSDEPTPTAGTGDAPTGATQRGRVVSVTDGDTIRVRIDGVEYPVRYIGMDAPERGESLARQATRANAEMVDGARVFLERDESDTDRYDRLLRHVWLKRNGSWLLVSIELTRQGLAEAKSYPPDTKYDDLLSDAQAEAQAAGVGLWAETSRLYEPPPAATPKPTRAPTKQPRPPRLAPPAGRCDPSYPDVCIPPYPPDLDCADIPYDDIRVVGRDPHGFDGDYDGWGCES